MLDTLYPKESIVNMSSVETYLTQIKPAIDNFIKQPTKQTLAQVEEVVKDFEFGRMPIFHTQVLVPLVIKLDELTGESQELRTILLDCLRHIISKLLLSNEKGLRSILVVALQQIRDPKSGITRPNLSEEIKLAAVLCIMAALRNSSSDVQDAFYTKATEVIIGQILRTLLEFIAYEKYRKLVNESLQCLMVVFYVDDKANSGDVVLRNQVANIAFIFLPKVVTVLFKTCMADDKVGENIKTTAVKALGRIICIMFEETTDDFQKSRYDLQSFKMIFDSISRYEESPIFGNSKPTGAQLEERLKQHHAELRSAKWISETSQRMRPIFVGTSILRAHNSVKVRKEYAEMCCLLLRHCAHNLKHNFIHLLEVVVALSEDEEPSIAEICQSTLSALQQLPSRAGVFDENAEILLDTHLNKLPRILHRWDDNEQFAELLFFKGFVRNINSDKLQLFLLVPKNLDLFVMCVLTALDLQTTRDLLNEEYSLRSIQESSDNKLLQKLHWRQFKYLRAKRNVDILYDIVMLLGCKEALNHLIFDYCIDRIQQRSSVMNEAILLLTLLVPSRENRLSNNHQILAEQLLEQVLNEEHWNLALKPDSLWHLKTDKPSAWSEDRTPGLYEAAIEVRTQDYDSDDDSEQISNRVSILDAQYNVLHTCIVLDALGHCAQFMGNSFDRYVFRSLHQVLLKLASSNCIIHEAATFAFKSMQLALSYTEPSQFIERSTDYITYHLYAMLRRAPESSAAVEILAVVLQYSTSANVSHLDSIFDTIREECAKSYQSNNLHSYLRVFHAFLKHVAKWQSLSAAEIKEYPMQVDIVEQDFLNTWLDILKKPPILDASINAQNEATTDFDITEPVEKENEPEPEDSLSTAPTLPRHIQMTKDILHQIVKLVSCTEQTQQILALECLATGIPLLVDYEDELLPLVHLMWQPLIEKCRQKDALVLNRCFDLLQILGVYAKDFILKRSVSDVIPQLKLFLKTAGAHSRVESSLALTQEYKLQLKLLKHLPSFIQSVQLDGKHLHELLGIVALYLSQTQPKELQTLAVQFYQGLMPYNAPFVYVTLLPRAHLQDYKANVSELVSGMGFELWKL
ncbi:uncharacterized protein LOC115620397 [Scaptodrosophila lebanonensis]|uniref:Uncharacterized protein LOC115620397 n=1 Tax=Drosophila lebanonensis TaxID=7225 RepID=A0A6J2T074_DROLE|nr:uncharacterized protein LOC115620397 [Scaptodrosophila lebanonensis]